MGWAKFDDGYATHPKLLAAGLEARGLDAAAICHCAKHETDGFVADISLPLLAYGAKKPHDVAARLVKVGRWMRDDEKGGYWIHDYLVYNPSRKEAEKRREDERQRKAKARGEAVSARSPVSVSESRPAGHPPESERNPNHVRAESERSPCAPSRAGVARPVPTRIEPPPTPPEAGLPPGGEEGPSEPGKAPPDAGRAVAASVAWELAERKLRNRSAPTPVSNERAWLERATQGILERHGEALIEAAKASPWDDAVALADAWEKAHAPPPKTHPQDAEVAAFRANAERNRLLAEGKACEACDGTGYVEDAETDANGSVARCPVCNGERVQTGAVLRSVG